MAKESPSQTAGPYVHIGCVPRFAGLEEIYAGGDLGGQMITGTPQGERMALELSVLDGSGMPLLDALVEIWQPGPSGGFGPTNGFLHWGRSAVDAATGKARFDTLKPGAPLGQAPHILVWIVARGINLGLTTRVYFPDEDNSFDGVFKLAGARAATLVAARTETGYAHSIRVQGERETVFFDV